MSQFSPETDVVLRSAGWLPDRRIDLAGWKALLAGFMWHDAAERFLQEFGGIRVVVRGPGVTCSREPFEFDPELAVGEEGRFAELSGMFGRKFFPLGEFAQGEFFLAIDEENIIYLLGSWALRYGEVDQALEKLVSGVAPEKLDLPA